MQAAWIVDFKQIYELFGRLMRITILTHSIFEGHCVNKGHMVAWRTDSGPMAGAILSYRTLPNIHVS